MAVSVLAAERALAALEGREPGELDRSSIEALDSAPRAAAWARQFSGRFRTSPDEFHRFAAPHIARMGVEAIAEASVSDPDERLYDLLAAVIDECAALRAADPGTSLASSDTHQHAASSH